MEEFYSNIDDLIISFLKGEISPEEGLALGNWINLEPANKKYFKQIYKVWNSVDMMQDDTEMDRVLQKIHSQLNSMHKPEPKHLLRNFILSIGKWAAVVLVSVCTGAFIYHLYINENLSLSQPHTYNEITVPLGSKSKIHLPDGTEVILNAGSRLKYKMDFGSILREVDLIGEGYFKVAKQKDRPFIVHTNNANIKALGTEFNVKAYPDENITETILVEGSVAVNRIATSAMKNNDQLSKEIILKPGQKLQLINVAVSRSGKKIPKSRKIEAIDNVENLEVLKVLPSNLKIETSWKDNRWIVQGENLESLAVLLSRKFNVNIYVKDAELKNYKFSGTIENETIEQVFSIMKYTIPISYAIDKGVVIWTINKNLEKDYKEAY